MFAVDTNVLVYAANEDCPEHERCTRLLEEWREGALPWFLTWGIVYEFLRVSTHSRVFENPWEPDKAWEFVTSLLSSPGAGVLAPTDRHLAVVSRTLSEIPPVRGNLWHDFHVAVLLREHGIRRIYTRDSDFHRFPFLEVLDPLASG